MTKPLERPAGQDTAPARTSRTMRLLGHLGYALYFLITVIVGLEIVLRLLFSDPNYYWENRYLYASTGAFVNRTGGVWTYAPSSELRQVAVYGFAGAGLIPAARFRVEYDCRYRTNNLGLIQARDIRPGDRVVLVLGDSFTEGQGGCPWFADLEKAFPDTKLVNGGLQGTGVASWAQLAAHITATGAIIDRILIIAISNDFKRGTRANYSDGFLACMNSGTCGADAFWQPTSAHESHEALIQRSIERSKVRNGTKTSNRKLGELLYLNSYTYTFINKYSGISIRKGKPDPGIHPETAPAMAELLARDPKLSVIMVPQRDEVAIRRKNRDSVQAEQFLRERTVPFEWCQLAGAHYMPLDGHPNAAGYRVLADCAAKTLRAMLSR